MFPGLRWGPTLSGLAILVVIIAAVLVGLAIP
jgi:hypothetical protein